MDVQIKTFRIHTEADEQALNAFLHNKIVRHWSTTYLPDTSGALGAISSALSGSSSEEMAGHGSWTVFIAYEERMNDPKPTQQNRSNGNKQSPRAGTNNQQPRPAQNAQKPKEKTPREDYVPSVSEGDMPLFEAVRKWRNARARDEGVKPFTLFNNKQLEEIVKAKPQTADSLRPLMPDMSDELYERYRNELLGFLGGAMTSSVASEANSEAATA